MYIKCIIFSFTHSLAEDLKNFSVNITEWLLDALEDLPAQLGIRKMHGEVYRSASVVLCLPVWLIELHNCYSFLHVGEERLEHACSF